MKEIVLKPIGVIHSPYKDRSGIPIQGRLKSQVEAWLELTHEYEAGLKDLAGFSHAIILYHFHKSERVTVVARPFLEQVEHGIFAIRSPHRPNHIGLSVVKIKRIEANRLYFTEVDMFDGTPVLDIKPYIKHYDARDNVVCGWVDKHFTDGQIPDGAVLR